MRPFFWTKAYSVWHIIQGFPFRFWDGGDLSPSSGGGHMGGTEARWGGDLCVIRDMLEITFNFRKYMTLKQFFHHYTYE